MSPSQAVSHCADTVWAKIVAVIGCTVFALLIVMDILGAAREVGGL